MRENILKFVWLLFLGLGLSAHAADNPIGKFREVEPGVLRGASPGAEGVDYLKSIGVKTILNLDDREAENADEQDAAKAAGIREVALPMSGFWSPEDDTVNAALAALKDPALRPLFVHCQHGEDRTGLIVGLYRVEQDGWAASRAYAEMLDLGFHTILFPLDRYFRERTGFSGVQSASSIPNVHFEIDSL